VIAEGGSAPSAGRTGLSLEELQRLLAPFDLKPKRVRPLAVGTVNSNFRVDTDGGRLFVRVNEGKSEADVRYEAALLWHLGTRRFPTPQPLRQADGRAWQLLGAHRGGKYVTAFPWVNGQTVPEERITIEHAGRIGWTLGQLHRATDGFAPKREGIYTFERIVRRIDGLRGEAGPPGRPPAAAEEERLPRVAGALPVLGEEVAWLREHRAPSLPEGTIHGDLFADNVLWLGGEVQAVLDFEQASRGRFIYDLAVTLLAWCWTGDEIDPSRARALSSAYRRARPLDDEERGGFFAEARLAALRFTVTRITDVFLPGLDRPGKDFRDYLARLLRLRELGEDTVESLLDPVGPA
jgi:homoserine kinase type II